MPLRAIALAVPLALLSLGLSIAPTGTQAASAATAAAGTGKGTVTGVAEACSGRPAPAVGRRVTVTVSRGSRVVGRQMVVMGHTYRFAVSPGEYVVSTRAGKSGPLFTVHLTVAAGTTVHADLPTLCR